MMPDPEPNGQAQAGLPAHAIENQRMDDPLPASQEPAGPALPPIPPPPTYRYPVQPQTRQRGLQLARLNIQPMTLVDILDRTIWLYRRNFVTFLLIIALIEIPFAIATTLLSFASNIFSLTSLAGAMSNSDSSNAFGGVNWIALALVYLLQFLHLVFLRNIEIAALTGAIATALTGAKPDVRSAYRGIAGSVISLTVSGFLLMLLTAVLGVIAAVVFGALFAGAIGGLGYLSGGGGSAATAETGAMLLGLIFIGTLPCMIGVALIPLIYVYVRLAFAPQAIIIEGCGPIEGLQRSWALVSRSWWRTFGILALLMLLQSFLVGGPAGITQVGLFVLAVNNPLLAGLASQLVNTVLTIIFTPISIAGLTLLYFDLRMRKEGLDLDLMVRDIEAASQAGVMP